MSAPPYRRNIYESDDGPARTVCHSAATGGIRPLSAQSESPPTRSVRHRPVCESIKGFTLLEVLVAVFIFAIIAVTVFGSYAAVFSTIDTMQTEMERSRMADRALRRMLTDLLAVTITPQEGYTPPEFNDEADPLRFSCTETYSSGQLVPRLSFATAAYLPIDHSLPAGPVRVDYYLDEDENQKKLLRRRQIPDLQEPETTGTPDPVLCRGVASVFYRFYDAQGLAFDFWDSDSTANRYATPRAVEIVLMLEGPNASRRFQTRVSLPVYREGVE